MNPHFERARATLRSWDERPDLQPAVSDVFECHIFCEPLDPDEETRRRFLRACDAAGLKALCLGLDYEGKGVVDVLQTTKYYEAEGPRGPVESMLRDADALSASFEVIRLKLEAMATNAGVPRSDSDMRRMNDLTESDLYFEHHIKLTGRRVTPQNDELLKALARELTSELGIKIPFSCNNLAGKTQRFLNARTYRVGYDASRQTVQRVVEAARARGFETSKVIEEFVVFDTNKDLDRGWLEF